MVTLDKLEEALLRVDEVQILELLDLKTKDILERFEDVVLARRAYLNKEMEFFPDEEHEMVELNFEDN
jgi:hypothetical protein